MSYYPSSGSSDISSAVIKAIGDNPIAKSAEDETSEGNKRELFGSIHNLVSAAEDLYCDQDMEFDTVIQYLSDALLKLKGKEQSLMKADTDDNEE